MSNRFEFHNGESKTRFHVELVRNGVFFPVRVNSSRPLWFCLDSVASTTFLDHHIAVELNLEFTGSATVRGAGEGTVPVKKIDNVSLELPGLITRGHEIHTTDLSGLDLGRPLGGFLGYDFLEKFVAIIDYKEAEMTVIEPSEFHYKGPGVAFPLKLENRHPFVGGTIEVAGSVVEDLFLVDSGSQDAVDHPLIAKSAEPRPTRAGVGLGRPASGLFGPIDKFQLGPFQMRELQGVADETGLGSRLIGGQVLSHFKVIFYYSRNVLILEKTGR